MTRNIESLTNQELKKVSGFFKLETMIVIAISFLINFAVIGSFSMMDTDSLVHSNFDFIAASDIIKKNLGYGVSVLYAVG